MQYTPEQLTLFHERYPVAIQQLDECYLRTISFAQQILANEDAKKYMLQGVSRRLGLVRRAAACIYAIYPPQRMHVLAREELEDVNINLHAFLLHCNAIQDNLAWSYVMEFGLTDIPRVCVSLFNDRVKLRLPLPIQTYVNDEGLQTWRATYSTAFRDALAHRVPAYVPPSQLSPAEMQRSQELQEIFNNSLRDRDFNALTAAQTEMNGLGIASPFFMENFGTDVIALHPQILCDAFTVSELVKNVRENWGPPLA